MDGGDSVGRKAEEGVNNTCFNASHSKPLLKYCNEVLTKLEIGVIRTNMIACTHYAFHKQCIA